jgi:hypothetical protein
MAIRSTFPAPDGSRFLKAGIGLRHICHGAEMGDERPSDTTEMIAEYFSDVSESCDIK